MQKIEYYLQISEPMFLFFIKNMGSELSQWIQYKGAEIEGDKIYFNFKSSQNSLSFKIYAGLNTNNSFYLLKGKTIEISNFFSKLKNDNIN